MKVNIDYTLEVTDEQRVQIANVTDQQVSTRQATREEMKRFIWTHGEAWAEDLALEHGSLVRDISDLADLL